MTTPSTSMSASRAGSGVREDVGHRVDGRDGGVDGLEGRDDLARRSLAHPALGVRLDLIAVLEASLEAGEAGVVPEADEPQHATRHRSADVDRATQVPSAHQYVPRGTENGSPEPSRGCR
jgi:hypothetical protein